MAVRRAGSCCSIRSKMSVRRWRLRPFIDQVDSDEGDSAVGQLSPANYPTQGRRRTTRTVRTLFVELSR